MSDHSLKKSPIPYETYQATCLGELSEYLSQYEHVFALRTRNVLPKAVDYIEGLLATERNKRNLERMSERTITNYQSNHHFLSNSPWSAHQLLLEVAHACQRRLGDPRQQCLSIDESCMTKSGKASVGVSRQYNGNRGKTDNCQVGVYAALSEGRDVGLVNCRLYLPDNWIDNPERCRKAAIPEKARVKKSKVDLALDMINELVENGIDFGWINADALYGHSHKFRNEISRLGKDFVVDIRSHLKVYLNDPKPFDTGKGRKHTNWETQETNIVVSQYYETISKSQFKRVKIRKSTKGWLEGDIHLKRVWLWDGKSAKATEHTLIIRKGPKKSSPVKYAISNLTIDQRSYQQFAFMQAQRFFIERAFEDAKGELGMADYQVRSFNAWYHHQALVMLAMDYINQLKAKKADSIPLLSIRDIRLQIIELKVNNGVAMEREIMQMLKRHKQRQADIDRHYPDEQSG